MDILIFAVIAVFLVLKLKSVLGTRNGNEQDQGNPFSGNDNSNSETVVELRPGTLDMKVSSLDINMDLIASEFNDEERIETGLEDIYNEDSNFNLDEFIDGSKYAFEEIVTSFSRGKRDELKSLLSPKLYDDFNSTITAREVLGHSVEMEIHRIKDAKIIEAHLGGTMAYITVRYSVEQTAVTKDKSGKPIEGGHDKISEVEDIWTFTRDIRTEDPNWIVIETRATEK